MRASSSPDLMARSREMTSFRITSGALEPFAHVGVEHRLDLADQVIGAAQDEAVEAVFLEQVEGLLGRFLVVVVDGGVDVALDVAGLLPLAAALDLFGDVRFHLVDQRDLAHEDLVPLGFMAVDQEGDQLVEFVQHQRQRPDEGIGVEDDAVAGPFGQRQDFPESRPGAGIDGQPGRTCGGVPGGELLDGIQVLQQ
jgi:hypothetical protein